MQSLYLKNYGIPHHALSRGRTSKNNIFFSCSFKNRFEHLKIGTEHQVPYRWAKRSSIKQKRRHIRIKRGSRRKQEAKNWKWKVGRKTILFHAIPSLMLFLQPGQAIPGPTRNISRQVPIATTRRPFLHRPTNPRPSDSISLSAPIDTFPFFLENATKK